MNTYKNILHIIDKIEYIDMHIHMEDYSSIDIFENILYFANAIDEDSYKKTLRLAEQFENMIPSFGIHPMSAKNCQLSHSEMEKLMAGNSFIGEIGIDNFWIEDKSTFAKQKEVFEIQLDIIKKQNMIPSIHTKGAEKSVLNLLQKYKISNAIIHWYSGPEELIQKYLNLGCYFTIGPDIFKDSQVYSQVPKDRILVETDNPTGIPWILDCDYKGNDIIKVYRKLSEKLGIDEKELISKVKQNLRDLIQKSQ